jgi:hypothetical protein
MWGVPALGLNAELGLKRGCFSPENDYLRKFYGGGAAYSAELMAWTEREGGWCVAIDYFKSPTERGDPVCYPGQCPPPIIIYSMIISTDISRIERVNWTVLGETFTSYFASGLSLYYFTESNTPGSSKYSGWKFGFNSLAGLQKNVYGKLSLVIDAKYLGQLGEQIPHLEGDIGGFWFCAGLRYSIAR